MFDGLLSAVQAYEQLQAAVTEAIHSLLEKKTFWQQSTEALDRFDTCEHPPERIVPLVIEARLLRNHIERSIHALALQMLQDRTSAYQSQMDAINVAAQLLSDAALDVLINCEAA